MQKIEKFSLNPKGFTVFENHGSPIQLNLNSLFVLNQANIEEIYFCASRDHKSGGVVQEKENKMSECKIKEMDQNFSFTAFFCTLLYFVSFLWSVNVAKIIRRSLTLTLWFSFSIFPYQDQ